MTHAENKTGKNPIYLLEDKHYERFPDFYLTKKMVIDAKYKHLGYVNIARDDIHQIISYLHVLEAKGTYLAYPVNNNEKSGIRNIGYLKAFGGEVGLIGLKVPQNVCCFADFQKAINKEEERVINKLSLLIREQ